MEKPTRSGVAASPGGGNEEPCQAAPLRGQPATKGPVVLMPFAEICPRPAVCFPLCGVARALEQNEIVEGEDGV
jgi:hypothetical protein